MLTKLFYVYKRTKEGTLETNTKFKILIQDPVVIGLIMREPLLISLNKNTTQSGIIYSKVQLFIIVQDEVIHAYLDFSIVNIQK